MAISYRVYANDGQGGAVDYSRPIATIPAASVAATGSFTTGPLARPSDNLFAVRAFDDASGVEEANTDARVRVVIDADGRDISSQPNSVFGLDARWEVGEVALVSWAYSPAGREGTPDRFELLARSVGGPASPAPVASPTAQVPYVPGVFGYSARLEGLATTRDWTIEVRGVGADGIGGPPASAGLDRQSGTLAAVDRLVAVASA